MAKVIKRIHFITRIVTASVFLISFILFACNYKNMPADVGIHFGPDGNFDVRTLKTSIGWVFYPFIVSIAYIVLFELVNLFMPKTKLGLDMDENRANIIRSVIILWLDALRVIIVFFYSCIWGYAVSTQTQLNVTLGQTFAISMIVSMIAFILYFGYMVIRYKPGKHKKEPADDN